jgi:quercetin dioxygenase-like cupin family protein
MRVLRVLVLALVAVPAAAQVIPVDQEPRHRIVFADEALRVLEVRIPAGDTTLEHRHDNDLATVNLENGRTRTRNSGADWGTPRVRMPGEVTVNEYSGRPTAHVVQNIDLIPYRLVGVENLRPESWSQGAPITAPGTRVLNESRAFRVYEVRMDGAVGETRHVHDVPVMLALIDGSVTVAGDNPQLGQPLTTPGQWAVVPAGQPHTVRKAEGAEEGRLIEIEVR